MTYRRTYVGSPGITLDGRRSIYFSLETSLQTISIGPLAPQHPPPVPLLSRCWRGNDPFLRNSHRVVHRGNPTNCFTGCSTTLNMDGATRREPASLPPDGRLKSGEEGGRLRSPPSLLGALRPLRPPPTAIFVIVIRLLFPLLLPLRLLRHIYVLRGALLAKIHIH